VSGHAGIPILPGFSCPGLALDLIDGIVALKRFDHKPITGQLANVFLACSGGNPTAENEWNRGIRGDPHR
jgi:hypothetical protein